MTKFVRGDALRDDRTLGDWSGSGDGRRQVRGGEKRNLPASAHESSSKARRRRDDRHGFTRPAVARAQSFALDPPSLTRRCAASPRRTCWSPRFLPPRSAPAAVVGFSMAQLGLIPGDVIDAFTIGDDFAVGTVYFNVSRGSAGAAGLHAERQQRGYRGAGRSAAGCLDRHLLDQRSHLWSTLWIQHAGARRQRPAARRAADHVLPAEGNRPFRAQPPSRPAQQ